MCRGALRGRAEARARGRHPEAWTRVQVLLADANLDAAAVFLAPPPPSLLLPLPVSLLYTHSPPPYCCPYPCPYCTLTPPLPTVAPTRVPTVYSLPLSLGVSRAAALGRRGPRRPRGVAPPREPAGDEAWPACVVAASD